MNLIEQAKKQAAQAVLNAYHAAVQAGELPEGFDKAIDDLEATFEVGRGSGCCC